jgi:dTDP-glucose pyrophosphorylase
LEKETKGAACSVLMAIDKINNGEPLIIANADQLFDIDLNKVLDTFDKNSVDAGVICFEAVHPRWSFVRLNEKNKIIETAEKRPISKNAIAGFYYFKQGKDFVAAAMGSIRKDANVDGLYYISPTFNELVLSSKNLEIFSIPKEKYHTFYTPQKIKEYEELCK